MTSKEKIKDILNFVQNETGAGRGFMLCLQSSLDNLAIIAQTEGIKEARDAISKVLQ